MDIKRAIFLLDISNLPSGYYWEIKELLMELEQRREEAGHMSIDSLDKIINEQYGNGEIAMLLRELKQRRESDLRPADKFLDATENKQLLHVHSEIVEIQEALFKLKNPTMDRNLEKDREHLAEEIADAQMSLETLFAICGFDERQRMEARRKVIEKNRERGYYNR